MRYLNNLWNSCQNSREERNDKQYVNLDSILRVEKMPFNETFIAKLLSLALILSQ